LSTDVNFEAAKVLEIYALRWAVEVYFKEAKQHPLKILETFAAKA
jgi:hypothetical protein